MNIKTIITLLALAAFAAGPSISNAQTDKKWTVDVSMNGLAAGMSGEVTVKGVKSDVDVGFGDVLEHLKFGAMGAVRIGYDRWALNTEVIYMHLDEHKGPATVDFEQWNVEPTLSYRVCDCFEVLAGARYNNLSGSINVNGPLGNDHETSGTIDWWDPIIGAVARIPLGGKFSFNVRGDVGGFGVGSDLTWQAFPYLNWQISRRCSLQAGYRWIYNDYSQGSGSSRFRYDVLAQGPQVGFTTHF